MTMDQIEAVAAKKDCYVIVAKPNELQFDLDSPDALARFEHFFWGRLNPFFGANLDLVQWRSKSGNHHAVVTLPAEMDVVERIALQAQGSSDPGREFSALMGHRAGSPHPVLLFKPIREQS
jgi:hypothetical protein